MNSQLNFKNKEKGTIGVSVNAENDGLPYGLKYSDCELITNVEASQVTI